MRLLGLLALAAVAGAAQQELDVIRKKPLWLDQQGVLRIDDSSICFTPKGDNESPKCWSYQDIQHLDRVSTTALTLLSYEDAAWKLGRDRSYRFELLTGEFPDALFGQMSERIGKPVTNRVVQPPSDPMQGIPAKHLKTFGGSEGSLYLSAERIVYATKAPEQSREWRLDRETASIWSSDPYRLEIHVYEGNADAFRQPRVYKFALKRPLDAKLYQRLKLRLYEVDRERGLSR